MIEKRLTNDFVFFGSSRFSVIVLEKLAEAGLTPALIVTTPDKPKGRGLTLTHTPVKEWALAHKIPVLEPSSLSDSSFHSTLIANRYPLFLVASYGKIIPKSILDIPAFGSLNVHPSLLPKLRGPSPIQTAILNDTRETGVSIMLMDEQMDHGPVVASAPLNESTLPNGWPPTYDELETTLGETGGTLLAKTIPRWLSGTAQAITQNERLATYTKKITKEDGETNLADDPSINFRKIQAYAEWPGAYFFAESKGKKIRALIKRASFENGSLTLLRVIPEGKREMDYADFLRGLK